MTDFSKCNKIRVSRQPSTYFLGGYLSGLITGNIITIQNNNGETLNLVENGPFKFLIHCLPDIIIIK